MTLFNPDRETLVRIMDQEQIGEILEQLKALSRLESKLDAATNKVTEDLDVIRGEIVNINNDRKEDMKQINEVKKSINSRVATPLPAQTPV